MKSFIKVLYLSFVTFSAQGQNLLPTNHWTVGTGNITNFIKWGNNLEDSRVESITPYGSTGILWKAANSDDESGSCDGGWVSEEISIDHSKDYRFSVWIKKMNSFDGTSYFGCGYWGESTVSNLAGAINTNPYFFARDLPSINEWYLLVAYVWNSSAPQETKNQGGVYDVNTYSKVGTTTDYKFLSSAIKIRHRAFNWYDPNLSDVQYFYAPRIEVIDGTEPTIDDLLRYDLTAATKTVYFNYDASGNRTDRFFGQEIVSRSSKVIHGDAIQDSTNNDKHIIKTHIDEELSVTIYPNPTKGQMIVEIAGNNDFSNSGYEIFDFSSKLLLSSNHLGSSQKIDIEHLLQGSYVLKIRVQERSCQWIIIKQ